MLSAKRKSDGQTVSAYCESKRNGPFFCLECGDVVVLRAGKSRVNYFAHAAPRFCRNLESESDAHRRCKMEIFEALRKEPNVQDVALERSLGTVRPDVSAYINGVPVAVEIQMSSLSIETIMHRTIEYFRKGIYVLWLLQWTPKLDAVRYSPNIWEKWIHATYFGQVYYWESGLSIACYEFEPSFQAVPKTTWFNQNGIKRNGGGYSKRSKRYRSPVRTRTLNLTKDFGPKERFWWEGNGIKVPDAKLFMHIAKAKK